MHHLLDAIGHKRRDLSDLLLLLPSISFPPSANFSFGIDHHKFLAMTMND